MSTPTVPFASQFQDLPIAAIRESSTNPRKHFDEAKLNELASNIRTQGVLVPLLVRPTPHSTGSGDYELIAGARRYRAARIAQLETVPARIREMTDAQVLEVQVVENLQREDVNPLEEAEGYAQLIAKYGYTVELLAEKVSRSESYIHKRLKLADLCGPAKTEFLLGRIQLGHALLLCRLEKLIQEEALRELWKEPGSICIDHKWVKEKEGRFGTAHELDAWIRAEVFLDLSTAPWFKDDAALVPAAGPCTICPKRTGANALLFDDVKKGDHCLDPECFEKKRAARVVQVETEHSAKGKALVKVATNFCDERELKKLGALSNHAYTKIARKADRCHTAVAALVVHGHDAGHMIDICRDPKCPKHGRFASSDGDMTPAGVAKQEAKRRRELLDKKIDIAYRRELVKEVSLAVSAEPGLAEWLAIAGKATEGLRADAQKAIGYALGEDYATLATRIPEMNRTELVRFTLLCSIAEGAAEFAWEGPKKLLRSVASSYGLPLATIEHRVADPLREKFKKSEAKRKAKEKASKAKTSQAETKKPVKKKAKRSAGGTERIDKPERDGESAEVFEPEGKCRKCGCTDSDCRRQCIEKTGEPCYWVEPDLCSACAEETMAWTPTYPSGLILQK